MSDAPAPWRYRLAVDGMACPGCAEAVHVALSALPGVRSVDVEHDTGAATLRSSVPLTRAAVARALADAGYALHAMSLVEDAA